MTDLAVDGDVAPSTQNQSFYALQYFFENVLKRHLGDIDATRSTKAKRIPTVMSKSEVGRVLSFLSGIYLLIGQLLYGCGMRISECLRLRVKDIDFDQMLIEIHNSKGDKSRFVPLPRQMVEPLRRLMANRLELHERDLANGEASVWLPYALDRKFPAAHKEFKWCQWSELGASGVRFCDGFIKKRGCGLARCLECRSKLESIQSRFTEMDLKRPRSD